ncbi:hypothetical protein QLH52_22040 [Methylomonas sp. OY6]|uniref:Uncharacterized protein n=1 Tax=Methylomonas defluvii TaxID=3045149 RepID=A0ABU4ULQ7_9GAMM|nr:hypothetical protein [Methylomonas sp. OY6]MDX8129988.1 hypothetical protein [Methylomonas sp. OY6]
MTQIPDKKDPEMKNHDNRWWEFYFVRYFVGTAIGAIVVLFLATADSPVFTSQGELASILKTLKPVKFESGYIAVLATMGLTFCYVASAPILVLHAIRGSLLKVRDIMNWTLIIIFTSLVLTVSGALTWTLWSALNVIVNPWYSQEFYAGTAFLSLVSLIFVGQLFLLWMAMSGREQHSFEYYDQLVKKRADAKSAGIEYVESYRHLREHGNAFFIALLELLLGAALFYSPVSWGVVVMLWIFPAAGIWLFGTLLESRNF